AENLHRYVVVRIFPTYDTNENAAAPSDLGERIVDEVEIWSGRGGAGPTDHDGTFRPKPGPRPVPIGIYGGGDDRHLRIVLAGPRGEVVIARDHRLRTACGLGH